MSHVSAPLRAATRLSGAQAIGLLTTLVSLVLLSAPLWRTDALLWQSFGVVLFAVGLWATGAIAIHVTALLIFLIAVLLDIAPAEVVFSGFHASATWLVFGGLVISLAAQRSGLAGRLVQALVTHLPARYFAMAFGIAAAGMLLSFIMPSASGRAVLMAPLALALAEQLGFGENTKARFGLVLAAGWGSTVPAFGILPSNVVNMAFIGASESIHGVSFTYFGYTVLNYPVLGILGTLIQTVLITLLFGAPPRKGEATQMATAWTRDERHLIIILLLALAFWVTDFWHGISPAWVAMVAAFLCMTPRLGVLRTSVLSTEISYGPWLFVAGVIGIGAIANHTGLGAALGQTLLENVPLTRDGGLVTFYEIFAIGAAVGLATTFPAAPPIMTTFADSLAQATGWPLEATLLAQVPTWMIFPLAHEAPPLAITMALGGVPMRAGLRLMVAYTIVGLAVVLPLQFFWGQLLGAYP